MKRFLLAFIIIINLLSLFGCTSSYKNDDFDDKELVYEDIADKIIRFHIIANSDTEEDQQLKLEVRDEVIAYVYDKLKDNKNLEESRNFIIENKEQIENIAKKVVKERGYDYDITSSLSMENFPDKVYGDVVFPQGKYEAYRILIGEAKGQNWWCVMFPPLCFLDEAKETIDADNIKETIEKYEDKNNVREKSDKERIINNEKNSKKIENKIEFKFKIFDIIKSLFNN